MISDSDLVTRLREILQHSDLDTATAGSVRRQLEDDFGVDLTDRKAYIRSQIDVYLQTLGNNEEEREEGNIKDNVKQNVEENDDGGDGEQEEEEDQSQSQETDSERSGEGEKEVKKRGGGFTRLCSLSPKLQNFIGEPQLARTQVVKRLWEYIRKKNLQDPNDRRIIKCDEALRDLFRVNSINMFHMNKALSKHIWPLSPEAENGTPKVKDEESNDSVSEGDNTGEEEEKVENRSKKGGRSAKVDKDVKKRGGGFSKLCSISPQLQVVTGAPELPRSEVVKRMWVYIREKNLQDPNNKRNILCDESLRALFDVDSIDMFQMNKALSAHIGHLNKGDGPDKSLIDAIDEKLENETQKVKVKGSNDSVSKGDDPSEKEDEEEEVGEGEEEEVGEGEEEEKEEEEEESKDAKKRGGGLSRLCSLSPQLHVFTGASELPRTEVVKRLWAYIREKNLQDPNDRRIILCDESLRALFGVDSINMFRMNKALSAHIGPLNKGDGPDKSLPGNRQCKREREDLDEAKQKEKQQKKGVSDKKNTGEHKAK